MTNLSRIALVLAFTTPLFADPISDLRTALARLDGRDSIRATYELQRAVANEGKFNDDKFTGKVTVELEGDASGFRVVFPRPLLDQLAREQNAEARNPKLKTPTVSAVNEIDPVETAEAIDFAPVLVRMVEGAKVVSDGGGTWQGKPVRVLVLRLADEPHDGPGKLTIVENKLTLWLGPDVVPLAAEHIGAGKFSFLVFKGESRQKRSWHLARVGNRLAALRHESTQSSSGMGQKGNESVVATVKVH
ncbi:MAG TPA: hypothetical protein VF846_03980 [Thermoanaerobaculia bacterium]